MRRCETFRYVPRSRHLAIRRIVVSRSLRATAGTHESHSILRELETGSEHRKVGFATRGGLILVIDDRVLLIGEGVVVTNR